MRPDLRDRWLALWSRLGGNEEIGQAAFGEIALHYGGDQDRAYHNFDHLEHGFREIDEVRELGLLPDTELDVLELKWWFHDVIYTIGQKPDGALSDEEASAMLLDSILEHAGFAKEVRSECYSSILCTKHTPSHPPTTPSERFLVDIDLAILGQPEDVFDEYEKKIRSEYSWVDPQTYATTRAGILYRMRARTYVYYTAHFHAKYEVQARANLSRSIRQLLQGP